jgi:hypothetical protein
MGGPGGVGQTVRLGQSPHKVGRERASVLSDAGQ